jgi:hypothetical protein
LGDEFADLIMIRYGGREKGPWTRHMVYSGTAKVSDHPLYRLIYTAFIGNFEP